MTAAPNRATLAVIETKRINGKPAHRLAGDVPGAWTISDSEIDAMLERVQLQTGVMRFMVLAAIGIDSSSITRSRAGKIGLPARWLLGLSDYSGIPVAELRAVACMDPVVQPHLKARRAG